MHIVEEFVKAPAFADLASYMHEFEPFKAMGIRSKELVHSRILATFLNKSARHGLGADFLNAFVTALAQPGAVLFSGERLDAAELLTATGPNVHSQVFRELDFIDLVIVFPAHQLVIGIENKVDAGEQEDQLARYQETLRTRFSGYRQALVFLTRTGRNPNTANTKDRVPVYCMGYGEVAAMLKSCKTSPQLAKGAAIFVDQFIDHIERYMTGNTQTKELCWKLFSEHEEAYKQIVRQYQNCIERKIVMAFSAIAERLTTDPILGVDPAQLQIEHVQTKPDKETIFYSLHVRMRSWPEGVWVKIYKHNWFGVFPFIHEADLARLGTDCRLPVSSSTAKSWPELRYVTARQGMDAGRQVRADGNDMTAEDVDVALALAAGYIRDINEALERDDAKERQEGAPALCSENA